MLLYQPAQAYADLWSDYYLLEAYLQYHFWLVRYALSGGCAPITDRCPVTQRIGWVLSDGTQGDASSDCTLAWGHKGTHVFDIYRTAGVQAEGLCWLYMSPEGKVHGPE